MLQEAGKWEMRPDREMEQMCEETPHLPAHYDGIKSCIESGSFLAEQLRTGNFSQK